MQHKGYPSYFRTTMMLLVLTCAVAAYILLVEARRPPDKLVTDSAAPLLELQTENLDHITIHNQQLLVELSRPQDVWTITSPIKARAAPSAINRLLSIVEQLPQLDTITAAQRQIRDLSLADYGLDTPATRIVLSWPNGRRTLDVGMRAPVGNTLYVRLDQQPEVIATTTNLLQAIPASVDTLRETRLLDGIPATVTRLEIKRGHTPLLQMSLDQGEWIIQRPVTARADRQQITQLLERIFALRINQFVSETMADPAAYGLNDEDTFLQITLLHGNEDRSVKLLFGKRMAGTNLIFAGIAGSSSVYALPAADLANLPTNLAELRDNRLYCMPPGKVGLVSIATDTSILQMRRDDAHWQIISPIQARADALRVKQMLQHLNSLRIVEMLEPTPAILKQLETPALTVRLAELSPPADDAPPGAEGEYTRVLHIARQRQDAGTVLAQLTEEPQVLRLSASATAGISANPADYRELTVMALDGANIISIAVTRNDTARLWQRDEDGKWISDDDSPSPQDALNRLVAALSNIRAVRFERTAADPALYGLQPARMTFNFNLTGIEGIRKTVFLGETTEDGAVFAMLQGQEGIFVLDAKTYETFLQPLAENSGL